MPSKQEAHDQIFVTENLRGRARLSRLRSWKGPLCPDSFQVNVSDLAKMLPKECGNLVSVDCLPWHFAGRVVTTR